MSAAPSACPAAGPCSSGTSRSGRTSPSGCTCVAGELCPIQCQHATTCPLPRQLGQVATRSDPGHLGRLGVGGGPARTCAHQHTLWKMCRQMRRTICSPSSASARQMVQKSSSMSSCISVRCASRRRQTDLLMLGRYRAPSGCKYVIGSFASSYCCGCPSSGSHRLIGLLRGLDTMGSGAGTAPAGGAAAGGGTAAAALGVLLGTVAPSAWRLPVPRRGGCTNRCASPSF